MLESIGLENLWLQSIWFVVWGLLWAIYFILDGFDLGMGTLMPFAARNNTEKRIIYNAAGPFWDGNEVWLVTAGGVTFAAFPKAYAVMFSALYAPLFILLFALIFRAVSFEFRGKIDNARWHKTWDAVQFLGSFLPAFLLGVTFANLFMGIPVDQNGVSSGSLLDLLNPYGLAGGFFFVTMFAEHGAVWMSLKSTGDFSERARRIAVILWIVLLLMLVLFLFMSWEYTSLFQNYLNYPMLFFIPGAALAALITLIFMLREHRMAGAWFSSAVFIFAVTFFGLTGMFPGIIISSLDPAWSVTAFNGAANPLTLKIMLGIVICVLPVVIAYQLWVYMVFSHPLTDEHLNDDDAY